MSTQTEKDSNKKNEPANETIIDKAVDVVEEIINPKKVPKAAPKTPKNKFADSKYAELAKKGNLPIPQIKSLIDSFKSVVKEGLSEEEYDKIWKKTFYRGSK